MINNSDNPQDGQASRAAGRGILQTVLAALSSAKLAAAVGCLIVIACILGTVVPQGGKVAAFVGAHPGSARLMELFGRVGLTNLYDAWWFVILLAFFALNVSACLFRRMSAGLRSGHMGISGWGFLLTHVSMLLILGGAVIRSAVGQEGHIEIQVGRSSGSFMTSRGPVDLPFEIHLVDFSLEYHEQKTRESGRGDEQDTLNIACADPRIRTQIVVRVDAPVTICPPGAGPGGSNALRVVVSHYVPDFVVDTTTGMVGSRSDEPNNPAIFVTVEGPNLHVGKWLFANHPEFDMSHSGSGSETANLLTMRYHSAAAHLRNAAKIKNFRSTLELRENGEVVKEKTIRVNSPLSYRGYTLYQSSYRPYDLTWSTIQVVKDPGVPIVYSGFFFLICGLVMLLCFKPVARVLSRGTQSPPDTEVKL